jgi:hypothetical protein
LEWTPELTIEIFLRMLGVVVVGCLSVDALSVLEEGAVVVGALHKIEAGRYLTESARADASSGTEGSCITGHVSDDQICCSQSRWQQRKESEARSAVVEIS